MDICIPHLCNFQMMERKKTPTPGGPSTGLGLQHAWARKSYALPPRTSRHPKVTLSGIHTASILHCHVSMYIDKMAERKKIGFSAGLGLEGNTCVQLMHGPKTCSLVNEHEDSAASNYASDFATSAFFEDS